MGKICIVVTTAILLHACSTVPRFTSSKTIPKKNTEDKKKQSAEGNQHTAETKKTESGTQQKKDGWDKMVE